YRGIEEGKDLFSPNRFPYADTPEHLMNFIGRLQEISQKPVGVKIVISDENTIDRLAGVAKRKEEGLPIPDFITVDSGEGGSATAPLELMESVGLNTVNALYVLDTALRRHDLREDIRIIASGKILTPDDVIITMSLGADAVGIARGFMMSGGCIRARMCSGYGSHKCPVGMATQDPKKRASYMVVKQAYQISNYHNNLIKGMKMMLAIMGFETTRPLLSIFPIPCFLGSCSCP
ncbi:MAG: FMN-binding glutamate synthase family protein, partial [Epsilonproteobacteria bacterium 4484_20]